MENQAEIYLDGAYVIGEIDSRMRGSFVEHLGRCLYGGLYEPDHPLADAQGFREDVKALIRELGISCLRYPGGNFVSGYNWRDGIGPREQRPRRKELAWNTVETNQVGTDEFARLCRELGVGLIMACNLGTGTPREAGELADYCRTAQGTSLSQMRRQNGSAEPYDICAWCLGNEMDGAWQIAALDAESYARKAKETAKIIRWTDPQAQTVACGSCTNEEGHETFGDWDRVVLEHAYDEIDYLSIHRYYNYHPEKRLFYASRDDLSDVAFFFRDLSNYIETVVHACDFVRGKLRRDKRVHIAMDEWGLAALEGAIPGGVQQEFHAATFSALDAVLYGGILCTLLNHADRVKIACQSLLVNEGGMITTIPGGAAFRQSIFYPFRDMARLARGVSLRPVARLPRVRTGHHGEQESLTFNASYDAARQRLCLLLANCDLEKSCQVQVRLHHFHDLSGIQRSELYTEDWRDTNTFACPERVTPHALPAPEMEADVLRFTVRPHSWNVITLHAASDIF